MIKHILKIIWNERRTNSWIIIEYVLVFCVLWFCCDYLFYVGKCFSESQGHDLENTYRIVMKKNNKQNALEKEYTAKEMADIFQERIKRHPSVENISFSQAGIPDISRSSGKFRINGDSIGHTFYIRRVSPSYFDVLKIPVLSGNLFSWYEDLSNQQVFVSVNRNNTIGSPENACYPISKINTIADREDEYKVTGVTGKLKNNYFTPYLNIAFLPLRNYNLENEIIIRTKPENGQAFIRKFNQEMKESLSVGNYQFQYIQPLTELRGDTLAGYGIFNNLKSIYSIMIFLGINIFLGIIGTFWYRTQARQSEIGLRLAMGATRKEVWMMMYGETLLLLFIASLIGVNICINLVQTDLLEGLGLPSADYTQIKSDKLWYSMVYLLTFLFLALVSLFSVWYPARQASRVEPAESLRTE